MGSGGEFILTKILQYSDMNWWKPLFIIESNDQVNRTLLSSGNIERIMGLPVDELSDNKLFSSMLSYLKYEEVGLLSKNVMNILHSNNIMDIRSAESRLNHDGPILYKSHKYFPEIMGKDNVGFIYDDTDEMNSYRIKNAILKVALIPLTLKDIRNTFLKYDPEIDIKLEIIQDLIGEQGTIPGWVARKVIKELKDLNFEKDVLQSIVNMDQECIIKEFLNTAPINIKHLNFNRNNSKLFRMSEILTSNDLPNHYGIYGESCEKFLYDLNIWHNKNLELHKKWSL